MLLILYLINILQRSSPQLPFFWLSLKEEKTLLPKRGLFKKLRVKTPLLEACFFTLTILEVRGSLD